MAMLAVDRHVVIISRVRIKMTSIRWNNNTRSIWYRIGNK
jgi:hypothetical protein